MSLWRECQSEGFEKSHPRVRRKGTEMAYPVSRGLYYPEMSIWYRIGQWWLAIWTPALERDEDQW